MQKYKICKNVAFTMKVLYQCNNASLVKFAPDVCRRPPAGKARPSHLPYLCMGKLSIP